LEIELGGGEPATDPHDAAKVFDRKRREAFLRLCGKHGTTPDKLSRKSDDSLLRWAKRATGEAVNVGQIRETIALFTAGSC